MNKQKIDSAYITHLINMVWVGVENSKAGLITKEIEGKEVTMTVAYQTFLSIISNLIPKNVAPWEDKEDWQK